MTTKLWGENNAYAGGVFLVVIPEGNLLSWLPDMPQIQLLKWLLEKCPNAIALRCERNRKGVPEASVG